MTVKQNYERISEQINAAKVRAKRNDEVTLIAVTKQVSTEVAKEVLAEGILQLGENRFEGLKEKQEHIKSDVVWHFIGSLQTRKVKDVIHRIDYLHSLDRLSLAEEIQKRAAEPLKCFIQVNVSGEDSKHGIHPNDVIEFARQLSEFDKVQVVGLMTMAPFTEDVTIIRNSFKGLKELQEKVKNLQIANISCSELSMGMSNDFEIAIEEGATFIRIGTDLVGKGR
ncbi:MULTISPECIES: YggS family pyridoxal phosphate-dependent enzyme [Bacillaceae]|uniref:YggS family pyridoxal phosphate-dependent enzyme n=1 Tax=Bacillaceae TaxID=186817 RepID=UPI000BEB8F2B|nr:MULTISPECIES: YggS family pyridoxal phosphate-dependent enzyme [unclassified Bacillus (in: firmicutes)]PEC49818.1 YggS family pyridoxal phosphate-dependent enzyme [Bacillus sp. AFS096315]PFM79507.1 YggS family pyridoxal phosphate-dependent enzyme [Bacillus sp. AFS077874]